MERVHYSPVDPAIFEDPYPVYRRLREQSPVHYLDEFDCGSLSTFEDVWRAYQSPDIDSTGQGTTAGHVLQHTVELVDEAILVIGPTRPDDTHS
jgi:hypothetical protein